MILTFEVLMKKSCYNYSKTYLPWERKGLLKKNFKHENLKGMNYYDGILWAVWCLLKAALG